LFEKTVYINVILLVHFGITLTS